jgi:hypothetical protein
METQSAEMTSAPISASAEIAAFLNSALGGGTLSVAELEAKARTAGLLGEHQSIQHAKAFKKAKKALGIRSIRNGFGSSGKWAWVMAQGSARTEIAAVANPDRESQDQHSIRDQELPGKWAAASESRNIIQQWIEGVQRLDYVRCPPAVPAIRWHLFLGDCHIFLSSSENWAERAAAFGWSALALFGCHRTRPLEHLGSAGLLWVINGGNLVELHRDWAVIERRQDKSQQVYHRRRQDEAQVTLPWIGPRAKSGFHR